MKLANVVFEKQVNIPGIGIVGELNGAFVSLRYDRDTNQLLVGEDGWGVAWGNVLTSKRDRSKPEAKVACPECQRQFNNAMALAGHKRQSGHGKAP